MLSNNNIELAKFLKCAILLTFLKIQKEKHIFMSIKLDKHDIFKCVTYLAPLKCECRVGGMVANRQILFSKKKGMCGQP